MRKEYSPEEALAALLNHLGETDPVLADHVRQAIDAGIEEEQEQEVMSAGRKPKRVKRKYRKARVMTAIEALHEAAKVFKAYFLERRLIANSALEQFKGVSLGEKQRVPSWSKEASSILIVQQNVQVPIQIELQRESEYVKDNSIDLIELAITEEEELLEIRLELDRLQDLLDFEVTE